MQDNNKVAIRKHLELFKSRGEVVFKKTFEVPFEQRIPMLAKTPDGRITVLQHLSAAIGAALNNIQVKERMSADQIVELTEMIIDQSEEDYLSIEDVLLFLQGLLLGKYGKVYERLDIPMFFEKFEAYRQKRHKELLDMRYEEEQQYKKMGDSAGRKTSSKDDPQSMIDLMGTIYGDSDS